MDIEINNYQYKDRGHKDDDEQNQCKTDSILGFSNVYMVPPQSNIKDSQYTEFMSQKKPIYAIDSHERWQNELLKLKVDSSNCSMPFPVNAKQYHRILKRRQAKKHFQGALEELLSKPYLHESRHRHAVRRPRGPSGRFVSSDNVKLNSKLEIMTIQKSQRSIGEFLKTDTFSKKLNE
ncbi:hypothetical protein PMAC_000236 [Pneumocystis sp. 'macacae']|nr:hypothetical protein PMAC_000236 [Pneumocystis sp. 'macacae']